MGNQYLDNFVSNEINMTFLQRLNSATYQGKPEGISKVLVIWLKECASC